MQKKLERYFNLSRNSNGPFLEVSKRADNQNLINVYNVDHNSWDYYVDENFTYVINKKNKLPKQGWKIHISCIIDDIDDIILCISNELISRDISFKFISSKEKFIQNNSKYADRTSSGKFITIYPSSTNQFLKLLDILEESTRYFSKGPYILSDKRWKESNIFFRYGAFQKMSCVVDGKLVNCIVDDKGNYIPDERFPYYKIPCFIKEPDKIKNISTNISSEEMKKLSKYKVKGALHFSNSGGVYLVGYNNDDFVLKEGRKHSGLDASLNDGFSRIKHEFEILKILKDVDGVINVREYFNVWEHNYIVEDKAPGVSLHEFIMHNYPFESNLKDSSIAFEYLESVKSIYFKLCKIINSIHKRGIAIGDIHPENVFVYKKGNQLCLNIIDLESATSVNKMYNPLLATPGYSSFNKSLTFGENDWYSLYKIIYYLLVPNEISSSLIKDIDLLKNNYVRRIFGVEGLYFLNQVSVEVSRHTQILSEENVMDLNLKLPPENVSKENIPQIIKYIQRGMYLNFDYTSKLLFKGSIDNNINNINNLSISEGLFGILMALKRTKMNDINYQNKINDWIDNNLSSIIKSLKLNINQFGLFNGVTGICGVLYELGLEKESINIIKMLPDIHDEYDDISLYSGLSGLGISYLYFYYATSNSLFLKKSIYISEKIIKIVNDKGLLNLNSGLLHGLSGVILFFSKLGNVYGKYNNICNLWMESILNNKLYQYNEDSVLVIDDGSLTPYLGSGNVGILLVLMELDNYKNTETFNKLVKSCNVNITGHLSLFDGYSGFLFLSDILNDENKHKDQLISNILSGINLYISGYKDNQILVPDYNGMNFSMNICEGASGLLIAMSQLTCKNSFNWMPLPIEI